MDGYTDIPIEHIRKPRGNRFHTSLELLVVERVAWVTSKPTTWWVCDVQVFETNFSLDMQLLATSLWEPWTKTTESIK